MAKLLKQIYEEQIDQYCSEDQNWVQFVRDHFLYIRNSAQTTSLDAYRHNTMKYRLEDFLVDQMNIPRSCAWIVLLINQLGTNVDFRELKSILIPDIRVIQWLVDRYTTVKAQQNKS